MMYVAFPTLIVAMLGYMFFHAGFSMRRDRIRGMMATRRARWADRRGKWRSSSAHLQR
jgi:hypothetical protein